MAEAERIEEVDEEWVAIVHDAWTTLEIINTNLAFAFNRETGIVYKLPNTKCPFIKVNWSNKKLP